MLRLPILALLLATTPAFACDGGVLSNLMESRLPPEAPESFDVAEIKSVEGGAWGIYRAGGQPETGIVTDIMRTDYGEAGRLETRLTVSSPEAYAVTVTRFVYAAPIYATGAAVIREEKDIFRFCDGALYLPEEGFGPGEEYVAKAKEALATFDAAEIKKYVPELKR